MNRYTLGKMRHIQLLDLHRAFKQIIEAPTTDGLTADEMIVTLIDSDRDDRYN